MHNASRGPPRHQRRLHHRRPQRGRRGLLVRSEKDDRGHARGPAAHLHRRGQPPDHRSARQSPPLHLHAQRRPGKWRVGRNRHQRGERVHVGHRDHLGQRPRARRRPARHLPAGRRKARRRQLQARGARRHRRGEPAHHHAALYQKRPRRRCAPRHARGEVRHLRDQRRGLRRRGRGLVLGEHRRPPLDRTARARRLLRGAAQPPRHRSLRFGRRAGRSARLHVQRRSGPVDPRERSAHGHARPRGRCRRDRRRAAALLQRPHRVFHLHLARPAVQRPAQVVPVQPPDALRPALCRARRPNSAPRVSTSPGPCAPTRSCRRRM